MTNILVGKKDANADFWSWKNESVKEASMPHEIDVQGKTIVRLSSFQKAWEYGMSKWGSGSLYYYWKIYRVEKDGKRFLTHNVFG